MVKILSTELINIVGGTLYAALIYILSLLLFLTPGISIYKLFGPKSSISEQVIVGFPIGLGVSALLCAFVGWVISFNALYCAALIVVFAVILWGMAKKYRDQNASIKVDGAPLNGLLYFYAIIVILILFSYSSFGAKTPNGYAFKDLYATDLLHHLSVFVQLPKGIPPANPYFSGEPWHYYWISHIIPAFIYALSGFSLSPINIMSVISVSYSLIFVSVLFILLSTYFKDKMVITSVMIISIFAYGYNDLFVLFKYCVTMLPESIIQQFHLGYFLTDTHGEQFTGYSHGWFRSFLVEPHSTLALSILFIVFIFVKREGIFVSEYDRGAFRGLLLGMIFSIDAFIGAIAICWYTLATIYEWLKGRSCLRNPIYLMIWTYLPIVMIFIFLYMVKIISPGSTHLILQPNFQMIILFPLYYLIDYGPMGILGLVGIYLLIKYREIGRHESLIIMVVTCLFFMLLVNVSPVATTQMFRKAGAIIRIPLIFFSGICLQYLIGQYHEKRVLSFLFLSIVIALPTPFIDLYRLSHWETGGIFIKQEDLEAQHWIKTNLPNDSIIQDFPMETTPIVVFGERRVALGDWMHAMTSGIVEDKIKERFIEIRRLFETGDPNVALDTARKLSIDYIYINNYTREKFEKGSQKFDTAVNLFQKVYSDGGVSIYKVGPTSG